MNANSCLGIYLRVCVFGSVLFESLCWCMDRLRYTGSRESGQHTRLYTGSGAVGSTQGYAWCLEQWASHRFMPGAVGSIQGSPGGRSRGQHTGFSTGTEQLVTPREGALGSTQGYARGRSGGQNTVLCLGAGAVGCPQGYAWGQEQ